MVLRKKHKKQLENFFFIFFNQISTKKYVICYRIFETEEAKREFEEWKAEQEKKIAEKAKNEAMPK